MCFLKTADNYNIYDAITECTNNKKDCELAFL